MEDINKEQLPAGELKAVIFQVEPSMHKAIKQLALDRDQSITELMREMVRKELQSCRKEVA
jgi:hypothetical protein